MELRGVDSKFQTLKTLDPTPPTLKRPPNPHWMSPKYIGLIDKRAFLHRNPSHNYNVVRVLTISFQRSLMVESWRQEKEAVTGIEVCLEPSVV